MNRHRHALARDSRRAFTIYEMIICLVVLGIVMNVAARLAHLTVASYRQTTEASTTLKSQTQWLGMLRHDAWSSKAQRIDGGKLTLGTDGAIAWSESDGRITRSLAGEGGVP